MHLSHVAKNPHPGGKILTDRQKIYFTYLSSLIQPTCKAMFHCKTLSLIFKNQRTLLIYLFHSIIKGFVLLLEYFLWVDM